MGLGWSFPKTLQEANLSEPPPHSHSSLPPKSQLRGPCWKNNISWRILSPNHCFLNSDQTHSNSAYICIRYVCVQGHPSQTRTREMQRKVPKRAFKPPSPQTSHLPLPILPHSVATCAMAQQGLSGEGLRTGTKQNIAAMHKHILHPDPSQAPCIGCV